MSATLNSSFFQATAQDAIHVVVPTVLASAGIWMREHFRQRQAATRAKLQLSDLEKELQFYNDIITALHQVSGELSQEKQDYLHERLLSIEARRRDVISTAAIGRRRYGGTLRQAFAGYLLSGERVQGRRAIVTKVIFQWVGSIWFFLCLAIVPTIFGDPYYNGTADEVGTALVFLIIAVVLPLCLRGLTLALSRRPAVQVVDELVAEATSAGRKSAAMGTPATTSLQAFTTHAPAAIHLDGDHRDDIVHRLSEPDR
jgi:hypothetical protein